MNKNIKILSTIAIVCGFILILIPLTRWAKTAFHQYQALANFEYQDPVDHLGELPPGTEGLLEIEAIKLRVVVSYGVSEENLKKGPGFFPQSAHPETGNVSIGSHRGAHGSYFLRINKLKEGNIIFLTMGGKRYHYSVRNSFVTTEEDMSVIEQGDKPMLTLITCLIHDNTRRVVVKADLIKIEELEDTEE